MLERFLPDQHVNSIYDITPDELKSKNVKGIITDLDNTLVAWHEQLATPELMIWFKEMQEAGIAVTIVSNNQEKRVRAFSEPLDIPFISQARKPLTRAFEQALREMGLAKDDVVVIGDQLLTDVWGGKRLGVHTILVVPVAMTDSWTTKLNRKIERFILKKLRRKGLIDWED
ncbi:YqeG family HAD IIIA-type phosphatase [Camelliibacillus cellulosilyticus]|uniref:YqeG family HAD IIIA-type phosphatase n=1 Tax=Camelliibacillus cellulosilyticus TaxID=2174486 RepID=A0ABV9GN28_9BACL